MAEIRVGDVMLTPGVLVNVRLESSVQSVLRRVKTGQVALAHEGGLVAGLLEEGILRGNVQPHDQIGQIVEYGVVPGVTTPETPAKEVIGIIRHQPRFRWFLVESGGETVGVVAPMAAALVSGGYLGGTSSPVASQIGRLWGDPIAPTRQYCFCCQGKLRHCISPAEARNIGSYPRPVCPHDGTLMRITTPCPR